MGVMELREFAEAEWMYELEAAADKDPYGLTNQAFEACSEGNLDRCKELLETRNAALQKAHDAGNCAEEDNAPDAVAYRQLKEILALEEPELYVSDQGSYYEHAFNLHPEKE